MLTIQLANLLQNLQCPGDFYAKGTIEIFPPCLEVNKVGRVSLPLLPAQAEQLIKVADQAPYGKGYETLIDTEVRKTWQIDAAKVSLSGKYWQKNLGDIVSQVTSDLGVNCEVSPELYKLLVYDKGNFFLPHRDTEKAESMFATLIIVLPSVYSGGELVIRHQQDEVKLELGCQESTEIAFAAFYADCVHEVLPVTDGCRLTLVYNLIRTNKKMPLPTLPDYQLVQQEMTALLNIWVQDLEQRTAEETTPEKLIYLLKHAYSIAELSFDALKNEDAASAEVLITAAKQSGCDLYLALASVEESGSAEHIGGGYYDRWHDDEDEDDFEIGEVFDRYEKISEWRSIDGSQVTLPTLPFKEEEFCPPEAFEQMEPEDIEFQEATGNAGASFERMYHCAALAIWPKTRHLAIINQAGLSSALPVLKDLCQQWTRNKNKTAKKEAHTLATYLLRDWLPQHCAQSSRYRKSEYTLQFLQCLSSLADIELIKSFWLIIAEKGIYQKEDSVALAQASELLPWSDITSFVSDAITVSAINSPEACATLLMALCNKKPPDQRQQLKAAAQALFLSLPGDIARFPELKPWEHNRKILTASIVADMLVSFSLIDTGLAEKALDYMLAWPTMYDIDNVLLPACLKIQKITTDNELSALVRLWDIIIAHLQKRLAENLKPPADWQRDSLIKCSCKDCAELSQFLNSPGQKQWAFKAAEARRGHVQHSIHGHQCDLDFMTEKKSRPYSLVCTKNQASYERRVDLYKNDKKALACLITRQSQVSP